MSHDQSTPPSLVDTTTISWRRPLGDTLEDAVRSLATQLADAGRASDADKLAEDILAREAVGTTALPGGVALPHARSSAALVPSVAVATLAEPVPAGDSEASIVFLLAFPREQEADYLGTLQKVARAVVRPTFRDACRQAESAEELLTLATAALR